MKHFTISRGVQEFRKCEKIKSQGVKYIVSRTKCNNNFETCSHFYPGQYSVQAFEFGQAQKTHIVGPKSVDDACYGLSSDGCRAAKLAVHKVSAIES